MRHLIQKQEFNITASYLELAQQWESRAGEILRHVIAPAIEKCFEKVSAADSIQIIDRIEIDLGILHSSASDEEIKNVFTKQLVKALEKYPVAGGKTQIRYSKNEPSGVEHNYSVLLTGAEAQVECFVYFLLYGRLPWWIESNNFQFSKGWLESIRLDQFNYIIETLYSRQHARQRLVQQFNIELITALLHRQSPAMSADIFSNWKKLESISVSPGGSDFWPVYTAYWLYWTGIAAGVSETASPVIDEIKKWMVSQPGSKEALQIIYDNTRMISAGTATSNKEVQLVFQEILSCVLNQFNHPSAAASQPESPAQSDYTPQADSSMQPVHKKQPDSTTEIGFSQNKRTVTENKINKSSKQKIQEEELFGKDAGLVLLHPFMTELFSSLDLLDAGQQWISPTAQQTAVLLTAWLAHGHTSVPEYELIVPKLFCGMLWEEVMDTSIVLSDAHTRAATELLEAVIGHWKAIGKTSLDGLREGFIQREGKLSVKEDGWLITVEKKAQDILLARLPWGLSVVHFPWLKNTVIQVDWA